MPARGGLSRRDWLKLAAVAVWARKPPSEWSARDIDKLITDSPWARPVSASTGGSRHSAPEHQGIVRWESAQPIQDALQSPLPEAFANYYVISVNGLPAALDSASGQDLLDGLRSVTTLQPKGRPAAPPDLVEQQQTAGWTLSILFGFARDRLRITEKDQEVDFATRFGPLVVRATFNLAEMRYRGELAL